MAFGLQYLGRYIIGGSADSSSFLPWKRYLGSKSKVSHFDMHVFIEEEIAQLKIPMNNFLKMKIFEGIKDLEHEIPGLIFCKFSFSFDEIVQRLKLWNWYFICA